MTITAGPVGYREPHFVFVAPDQVDTGVRAVGEKVLALVQRRLKLQDIMMIWYQHRWLRPDKTPSQATIESRGYGGAYHMDDTVIRVLHMSLDPWQYYWGRTLPALFPHVVFVCGAFVPGGSDEGDMRPRTPYQVGLTIAHEVRHLWQHQQGWSFDGRRPAVRRAERDANEFAKGLREPIKVIAAARRGRGA